MKYSINLVPDASLYASGILKYITWNYKSLSHIVIYGATGSGKTFLLKLILARIGLHIPSSEIILCDFKADSDFSFADHTNNFYRFDQCMNGLEYVYQELQQRQHSANADKHLLALVFDEWASFINSLDKKSAEHAKQILSSLLMLGRSFNIHVIISQQRVDASYFSSARDNFSVVIGMGKLSKESVEMMFSEYKDVLHRSKSQGYGSMILGNQFKDIVVPRVCNRGKLESSILAAINRYPQDKSH